MIGAARHAAAFAEANFGQISHRRGRRLGRLDPGEANTSGVHTAPIDIALIFGDIDAANLIIRRARKRASPVTRPRNRRLAARGRAKTMNRGQKTNEENIAST